MPEPSVEAETDAPCDSGGDCKDDEEQVSTKYDSGPCLVFSPTFKYCCPRGTHLYDCRWVGSNFDCPDAKCASDEVAIDLNAQGANYHSCSCELAPASIFTATGLGGPPPLHPRADCLKGAEKKPTAAKSPSHRLRLCNVPPRSAISTRDCVRLGMAKRSTLLSVTSRTSMSTSSRSGGVDVSSHSHWLVWPTPSTSRRGPTPAEGSSSQPRPLYETSFDGGGESSIPDATTRRSRVNRST